MTAIIFQRKTNNYDIKAVEIKQEGSRYNVSCSELLNYVQIDADVPITHVHGEHQILKDFPRITRNYSKCEHDADDNVNKIKVPDKEEITQPIAIKYREEYNIYSLYRIETFSIKSRKKPLR